MRTKGVSTKSSKEKGRKDKKNERTKNLKKGRMVKEINKSEEKVSRMTSGWKHSRPTCGPRSSL
jgi:hypothetical protein